MTSDESTGGVEDAGMDRRSLIKKAGVAGAVIWAAPVIHGSILSPAGAQSAGPDPDPDPDPCGCTPAAVAFASTCQAAVGTSGTIPCTTVFDQTNTVCVGDVDNGATVVLARTPAGDFEPYADDLIYVTVTPSVGSPVNRTYRRQTNGAPNNCPAIGSEFSLSSAEPTALGNCAPATTLPAVNITGMFQEGCGEYEVRIRVANMRGRYAWSTIYVVPS